MRYLILILSVVTCGAAFAGQPCIQIDHVPFVAWTSGTYCVVNDLDFGNNANTLAAIEIRADNVTIDLQGFAMRVPTPNLQSYAILATKWQFERIVIRNGRIHGYTYGMQVTANQLTIKDLVIDNVMVGMDVNGFGVDIDNIVVRGRTNAFGTGLFASGGTWEVSRLRTDSQLAIGLNSNVDNIDVRDSYLAGMLNAAWIYGTATTLRDSDLRIVGDVGKDVVVCYDKSTTLIVGNTFSGGPNTENAINNLGGSGKYRDNTALGNLKYLGGTDAGGNV